MKNILLTIFAIFAFTVAGGCAPAQLDNDLFSSAGAAAKENEAKAPLYDLVKAPYPDEVEASLEDIRKNGGFKQVNGKDKTYVLIGLGQRPTGGYTIEVTKAEQNGQQVTVYVRERKPEAGTMTTQVISYPVTVVSLAKTTSAVKVVFE